MRTKTRNAFPHHHPVLPRLIFTYNSSASSPLSDIRERRMGVVDSLHRFVFAAPSFSLSSLAPAWFPPLGCDTFTNCSGMGPSHEPQFFKNCSNMCLYHGVHPSGTDCSCMGPPWAAAPTRTAPPWVYSPQALRSTSLPPSLLAWVSVRLFLTPGTSCTPFVQHFPPFLKYFL